MPARDRIYEWEWTFDVPPPLVWPAVSDTNRVNRLAGLPRGTYATVAGGESDGRLSVHQRFNGIVPVTYEETPFEWVEGERWEVERRFSNGPAAVLRLASTLSPGGPDGKGTRLLTKMTVTPRSLLTMWMIPLMMRGARRGLDRAYATIRLELLGAPRAPRVRAGVSERVTARFGGAGGAVPKEMVRRFAEFLASADAAELHRIRPFVLADRWGVPRRDVLDASLRAVRAGVLELHWDSLCPHCRGAKRSASSLADVRAAASCDACGVSFEVEFDRSLEAVFRPASDLRSAGSASYCVGGPGNTPHVVAQVYVARGSTSDVHVHLEPGSYRVRCPRRSGQASLRVETGGASEAEVEIDANGAREGPPAGLGGRLHLRVRNTSARGALVALERTAWLDDVATGLDVALLPGFRDLFAAGTLAPGERIAVRRVAILFTDLRGSTALYHRIGDAAAYARVRDHFKVLAAAAERHGGAVVKTIGDAVMAAFHSPAEAILAAADMHRDLAASGAAPSDEGLVLKAGMHCGPSIAVDAGGRLDYFGTTANLAARVEHEARGGDVVTTREVFEDDDVRRALAAIPHREETFRAPLKGFEGEAFLHRITFEVGAVAP